MYLEISIDDSTCKAALTEPDADPVRQLLAVLPLDAAVFVPSCWSGSACEVDLSGTGYDYGTADVFSLGCSLYPGMLSLRQDRKILEISYGTAESRSAAGVQYGFVIGRLDKGGRDLMAKLATSHDVGELRGSIRAVGG
jgi:hypothetical protein